MGKEVKVLNVQEVEKMWDGMTTVYTDFDCSPQSFYYSIINMLNLSKAKNVLQVGCGRCLLVPYTLQLMNPEATYLATDLSSKMIELAKKRIQQSLKKHDSSLNIQQWCQKHHLTIKAANGQQIISTDIKFDRIICNMVLMLTENPEKMLKSLYQQAQKGCLLGISVWGKRQLNLIQQQLERVIDQLKIQKPKARSNFHLYNKVAQIAQPIGWKLAATWQQVSVFPYLKAHDFESYIKGSILNMSFLSEQQKTQVYQQYFRRQTERLDKNKQALTFPAQISIFIK